MTELLALCGLGGAALGTFFFAGLWWTTRRSLQSRHPALLHLASLVLRGVAVGGGFVLLSGGSLARLAAALAGFLAAQVMVTWRLGAPAGPGEVDRAP